MKRRNFIKNTAALGSITLLPSSSWAFIKNGKLRIAYIGVGGKGRSDIKLTASHKQVEVAGLCDVDAIRLAEAGKLYQGAEVFSDYRKMLDKLRNEIDAVVVSTPDHTHAPASLMAMDMGKHVYCQKPLTHHVSEAWAMKKMAKDNNLVTQMGIQNHSTMAYRSAVKLIRDGLIGKVHTVRVWSYKNWGYDGPTPTEGDAVPKHLDWNLWLGTSPKRPYKNKIYHPGQWRRLLDYGCGTLGDMGVHIFDTPYTALQLGSPKAVTTSCRKPTEFGHPEENMMTYEFPGTKYTTDTLKWVWYDGEGAPENHKDLALPNGDALPRQGAMIIGEKGKMVLEHIDKAKLVVNGKYEKIDFPEMEDADHYHQFVNACMDKDTCSAPFSYAASLTETVLLGVVANRFPNRKMHWNAETSKFTEKEANELLDFEYRKF